MIAAASVDATIGMASLSVRYSGMLSLRQVMIRGAGVLSVQGMVAANSLRRCNRPGLPMALSSGYHTAGNESVFVIVANGTNAVVSICDDQRASFSHVAAHQQNRPQRLAAVYFLEIIIHVRIIPR